jgi:hypothetical protein
MFGFGTWDDNGVYNNYGIQPVNVIGYQYLDNLQLSATLYFNVPSGRSLRFIVIPVGNFDGTGSNRRQIYVSGNSVISNPAPNNVAGPDRFPNSPIFILGYVV